MIVHMRLLDWMIDSADCFARLLGPALVVLAIGIIGFCTFMFFLVDLWFYESLITKLCLAAVGLFFLFNVLWNYYKAVRTTPGIPPLAADCEGSSGAYLSGLSNRLRQYDEESSPRSGANICGKCDRLRPPRTHHCSVCRNCILRYDHHCMPHSSSINLCFL